MQRSLTYPILSSNLEGTPDLNVMIAYEDFETGKHVLRLLVDLKNELGKTILIITHNGAIAPAADRVIRLRSGEIHEVHDNPSPQPPEEISW